MGTAEDKRLALPASFNVCLKPSSQPHRPLLNRGGVVHGDTQATEKGEHSGHWAPQTRSQLGKAERGKLSESQVVLSTEREPPANLSSPIPTLSSSPYTIFKNGNDCCRLESRFSCHAYDTEAPSPFPSRLPPPTTPQIRTLGHTGFSTEPINPRPHAPGPSSMTLTVFGPS